jgi:YqaJ-like viral recombinase domain
MSAVLAMEPGSQEWMDARTGCLTASRMSDAFAKLKSGAWAQSRYDYLIELVAERLTGRAADHFVSRDMLLGIETEPDAIAAYEWAHDCTVEKLGYAAHPTIQWAGATPDGGVGDDGLIECKCPRSTTFVALRLVVEHEMAMKHAALNTDEGYLAQIMWQLACTGRQWCDLAYYDPHMPQGLQLYVRRIERDEKIIAAMETEARAFLAEVDALVAKLRAFA